MLGKHGPFENKRKSFGKMVKCVNILCEDSFGS